jgi:soluble lytic murein transglycosylase-like protein
MRLPGTGRRARAAAIAVRGRATAELSPAAATELDLPTHGGGGYDGPLAYRQGKPMRPDVAEAFDRLAEAARREARLYLSIASGFRSDAEQARLFASNPDPKWVARPGTSLHRYGTELDLGPPAAYGWLERNARRFGFIKRYSWEDWHYGYVHNVGSASVGYGHHSGDGRSAVPSFVPAAFHEPIVRASQRWNVGAALLAAQLYAESGFNPFAVSRAGARGIAQFMPATANAYRLREPFDPVAAIDAQAHLMRDLLRRFGSVPLALAAYNAGAGAVARCMCIPPFPETRAYVARILGLLGGAGEIPLQSFEVRLVE